MEEKQNIIYTNSTLVNSCAYDFRIQFFRRDYTKTNSDDYGELQAEVIMSPQHAKAFLNALQQNIDGFEEAFGVIDLNLKTKKAQG